MLKIKIKPRKINNELEQAALKLGLEPMLARIVASRALPADADIHSVLNPKLSQLDNPFLMADMDKAAERVCQAIVNQETIGLETDHDCDGQTAHAVLFWNLTEHFKVPRERIGSYIGHRLKEGYGLSQSVADRIVHDPKKPSLIITADNGSSDELRIKFLKEHGIEVIVTDHHQIPVDGYPKSAVACVNPTRKDCGYPDPCIAGCMVAWLLMAAVRSKLIEKGILSKTAKSLMDTLDFVAVGTVADCVSMGKSLNNRAVVRHGLQLIQAGARPCWRALRKSVSSLLTTEDVGFTIGPLLNSDGRLCSAFKSVSFLLAESDAEARDWVVDLQAQNTKRKAIQKAITQAGIAQALEKIKDNPLTLSLFLKEGHTGVHGISASRVKDLFGRPTAFFAPKVGEKGVLSGSLRGIDGFHVRNCLQAVYEKHPEIFIAFGGHQGAAGVTLWQNKFEMFSKAFEQAASNQMSQQDVGPVVWTDGQLPQENFHLDYLSQLSQLEPYGREFEAPVFEMQAVLQHIRVVGDGTHAKVMFDHDGLKVSGIWFGFRQSETDPLPVALGDKVTVAYRLLENVFQGNRTLEVQVVGVETMGGD